MKVLLVVIDGASPRVVAPAIQTGRLPNLRRIAQAGGMQSAVTMFPSITPAATSTIITGAYPAEHGIAGAAWYDEARRRVAYYGDDFWTITKEGYRTFLRDFLVQLNGDRLTAPTLFERVERAGRSAASINYLVYRGNTVYSVHIPWMLAVLPGVRRTETITGPSTLCLGDFVTPRIGRRKVKDRGGPLHRFGMDDASTAFMLCELTERGALGDFTVAYFADNDFRSHEVGPHAALPAVARVDAALGQMFDAAGGFDRLTRDTCIVVTSDHGHCEIVDDPARAVIRLDRVLAELRPADLAKGWRRGDEIMICPNMRAAQIYIRQPSSAMFTRVVRAALADSRIDLVIWHSRSAGESSEAYVVESQRGRLEFWRAESSGRRGQDSYGTGWNWVGDLSVLSVDLEGGCLEWSDYPNAFERLAGVLDAPNSGEVWLTAEPGCEFEVAGQAAHVGGGSHGALHALDSHSLLLVGGAGAPPLPRNLRTVDIAPLCMDLLGLSMRYRVGDPRPGGSGTQGG